MQIKNIVPLELFLKTVCEASVDHTQNDKLGRGRQIIADLDTTRSTSLAQQLENNENMMVRLANCYDACGQHKLALATRQLASALSDDNLLSPNDQLDHQRILNYVYPVV